MLQDSLTIGVFLATLFNGPNGKAPETQWYVSHANNMEISNAEDNPVRSLPSCLIGFLDKDKTKIFLLSVSRLSTSIVLFDFSWPREPTVYHRRVVLSVDKSVLFDAEASQDGALASFYIGHKDYRYFKEHLINGTTFKIGFPASRDAAWVVPIDDAVGSSFYKMDACLADLNKD